MHVELVDYTPNPEEKVATFSGICYNSNTSPEANERRVKHLMKVKHLSTLRFATATFYIGEISRACSHQFVRSKHLDFLQRSQRYVNEATSGVYVPSEILKSTDTINEYNRAINVSKTVYKNLIAMGVKKEDARMVLPTSNHTSLYVTGNLQAWKDFLALRDIPQAQEEIRVVAQRIGKELFKVAPNIFQEYKNG